MLAAAVADFWGQQNDHEKTPGGSSILTMKTISALVFVFVEFRNNIFNMNFPKGFKKIPK